MLEFELTTVPTLAPGPKNPLPLRPHTRSSRTRLRKRTSTSSNCAASIVLGLCLSVLLPCGGGGRITSRMSRLDAVRIVSRCSDMYPHGDGEGERDVERETFVIGGCACALPGRGDGEGEYALSLAYSSLLLLLPVGAFVFMLVVLVV